MNKAVKLYNKAYNAGLAPDPDITIWQWADKYRIMPQSSSEPGPYRSARTPYCREIMEKLSPSDPAQRIKVIKGTQLGLTEVINNWFLYSIDLRPGPLMMVLPTVDLAKRHSKKKLTPSIRMIPRLRGKIRDARTRDSGNTILLKEFPGGFLTLAGSNSAASFRSDSVRDLALDDIDGYPIDVDGEGDPCGLAENRCDASSSRKILLISTPTEKSISRIAKEYEDSDQRLYYVPCPYCKQKQPLEWGGKEADYGIKFEREGNRIKRVWYECKHCHAEIDEGHKPWMMDPANGAEWVPQNPGHHEPGYRLPSYYSPLGWVSWQQIVREFLAAKDHPSKLKRWVTTRDAKPYEESGDILEWKQIQARAEPYHIMQVPHGGLFLTASVDVQNNRLETYIYAWGRDEECWLIYAGTIYEDPKEDHAWHLLDELTSRPIKHASGTEMHIRMVAIDAGYQTQRVYEECRKRKQRWMAVMGSSQHNKPILGRPTLQDIAYGGLIIKQGIQLWPIGTDVAKETLYDRLSLPPPGPRRIHFPIGLSDEFYKGLCSEKRIDDYSRGNPIRRWVKIYERNEPVDGWVYAYAAAIRIGLYRTNWDELERSLAQPHRGEQWQDQNKQAKGQDWQTRLRGRVINPSAIR